MRPIVGRVTRALRAVAIMVMLAPVHLWRATVVVRQPRCRFYPSCSTYAVGALRVHGPGRGSALAAGRLLRCHPWSPGGIDHVPPRRIEHVGRARAGSLGTAPRSSLLEPSQSQVQSSAEPFGVRDA